MTLADLAVRLGCRLEGDGAIEIRGVAGIDDARSGDITFLANPRYAARVSDTRASAIIVDDTVAGAPCALLRTANPYLAFAAVLAIVSPPAQPPRGISPLAFIDPTAEIGADVSVGPFAYIGAGARIGAGTTIHPHVVIGPNAIVGPECVVHAHASIREQVSLGARVVIQDAAVIGADGFGFVRRPDGTHQKIPQVARVVIEDDVEIGAHSAVDRPAVGETRVGAGTKIDNLVQVAHGVKIGRNVLLAAQVGIAGSTTLGDDVVMAGQSGAAGHLHLGDRVVVNAKSAVTKDVHDGAHVAGVPAGDVADWRESVVLARRLPELKAAIARLESRLAELEARLR